MSVLQVYGPREKLACHGGDTMTTEELVAIILGTGVRGHSAVQVAAALLGKVGGLRALSRASPRELQSARGVGPGRAVRLAAAFVLGRRAVEAAAEPAPAFTAAEDVYRHLRPRIACLSQEVFVVLALDAHNRLVEQLEVARGWVSGVQVHPREVFRPLIRQAASAAILVHNHPTGCPEPSDEDVELTRRLVAVGELVGIPVLDHVIVTETGFASIGEML